MLFNGWQIITLHTGDYLISDAQGNQCITNYVRIINVDEFVIGHPVIVDVRINTQFEKCLPVSCRSNLTNPFTVRDQQDYYKPVAINWSGPRITVPKASRKVSLEYDD